MNIDFFTIKQTANNWEVVVHWTTGEAQTRELVFTTPSDAQAYCGRFLKNCGLTGGRACNIVLLSGMVMQREVYPQ